MSSVNAANLAVLHQIQYKDWSFAVCEALHGAGSFLQVRFKAGGTMQSGRKWYVSSFATKSEVVQTALKAVLTAEEHEAREAFLYRGAAIFGPHLDVDVLLGLADQTDARSELYGP